MRKTEANNPRDWLAFARMDLEAICELASKQMCHEICRSKLAECMEKLLKGELIRRGWSLVKTHDLVHLADELSGYDSDLAASIIPACEALAEAYFIGRYPGFDLDDPDWEEFARLQHEVEQFSQQLADRLG